MSKIVEKASYFNCLSTVKAMLLCRIYNQDSEDFIQLKLPCLRFKLMFLCQWTVRKLRFLHYWI